jgi:hypothetical protein
MDDAWENATPFNDQSAFSEKELFYIRELVKQGFEVRYDAERIYSKLTKVISIRRVNLK